MGTTRTDTVGQQVEKALHACGKLQKQVAYEAGFTQPNAVTMIKTGQMKIPKNRVIALADALEMDPISLVKAASREYGWPVMQIAKELLTRVLTTDEAAEILSEEQQRRLLGLAESLTA